MCVICSTWPQIRPELAARDAPLIKLSARVPGAKPDPNPNPDPDPDPNPNPAPARNPDPDPERPLYPPQAMGVYRKVRALYRNHIAPIVERYIGTILRPLLGLMYEHDVQLYVGQVSTFLTYLPP